MEKAKLKKILASKKIFLFDFDGVIKESNLCKTQAFQDIFDVSPEIKSKIKQHHILNEGISRYEKIPLYMNWADIASSQLQIDHYCQKFSTMVYEKVIKCDYVDGILGYLETINFKVLAIVTATPTYEIKEIINRTKDLANRFKYIKGAPKSKIENIEDILNDSKISCSDAIFFGDSKQDLSAAESLNIEFIQIKKENKDLFYSSNLLSSISSFNEII